MTKRRKVLGRSLFVLLAFLKSVSGFQFRSSNTAAAFISLYRKRIPLRHQSQSSDYDYSEGTDEEEHNERSPGSVRRRRPIRQASQELANEQVRRIQEQAQIRHEQALKDPTLLTKIRFQDREDLHPATKRALTEVLGLQAMTDIQAKTYAEALAGQSVLARSCTGTGKTLAFLLPAVERLFYNDLQLYRPGHNVGVLIVAPTRELALQISEQAKILFTYHTINSNNKPNNSGHSQVLCLFGGTKIAKDVALLSQHIPTVLVATPGRLRDHLQQTRLRGRKFGDIMAETGIVVLDEADRLVEAFPQETKSILSYLPRAEKRQTLLFSATWPKMNKQAWKQCGILPSEYATVDCVMETRRSGSRENKKMVDANARVQQSYVIVEDGMDSYISALFAILGHFLNDNSQKKERKIVVFFPTARLVKFLAEFFSVALKKPVLAMHSRMSQSARTRTSGTFRQASSGILFTTDISARGMDYDNVEVVVQYGSSDNMESYIHRLGRTGRAGKVGVGVLVLFPFEDSFLRLIKRRGILLDDQLCKAISTFTKSEAQRLVEPAQLMVRSGHRILFPNAQAAYLSLIAYYAARTERLRIKQEEVLDMADRFAAACGLQETPHLSGRLASKLSLDVPCDDTDD